MVISALILCSFLVTYPAKSSPPPTQPESDLSETLVSEIVLPFTQIEILSNSVGVHTSLIASLPNHTNAERELHTIAAAVSEQWADLRTIDYSTKLLSKTLHSEIKHKADKNLSHWDILRQLDKVYSQDTTLGPQYAKQKHQVERSLPSNYHFQTSVLTDEQKRELEGKLGPKVMLFRFLHAAGSQNYSVLAKAYVELAKDPVGYEKVQRYFDEALKEAARLGIDLGPEEQTRILYTTLKDKISRDEDLKAVLQKKNVKLVDKF